MENTDFLKANCPELSPLLINHFFNFFNKTKNKFISADPEDKGKEVTDPLFPEKLFAETIKDIFSLYKLNQRESIPPVDGFNECYLVKYTGKYFPELGPSADMVYIQEIHGFFPEEFYKRLLWINKSNFISCLHLPSMRVISYQELNSIFSDLESQKARNTLLLKRKELQASLDRVQAEIENIEEKAGKV